METAVETINGRPYTIIRRPFDVDWISEQIAAGIPVLAESNFGSRCVINEVMARPAGGSMFGCDRELSSIVGGVEGDFAFLITILPALSKRLTAEEASKIARYRAEGLYVCGLIKTSYNQWEEVITHYCYDEEIYCCSGNDGPTEISSVRDQEGNLMEVAIL